MLEGLAWVPNVMRMALPTSTNRRPTAFTERKSFICSRVSFIASQR